MHWCPRQIPKTGIFPAAHLIRSTEIPACLGFPGPGLIKSASGEIFSTSSIFIALCRITRGSALSSS